MTLIYSNNKQYYFLHSVLCPFQAPFWHSRLQYLTKPHPPHDFRSSDGFPHPSQVGLLFFLSLFFFFFFFVISLSNCLSPTASMYGTGKIGAIAMRVACFAIDPHPSISLAASFESLPSPQLQSGFCSSAVDKGDDTLRLILAFCSMVPGSAALCKRRKQPFPQYRSLLA